jgi:hypothetical protein
MEQQSKSRVGVYTDQKDYYFALDASCVRSSLAVLMWAQMWAWKLRT